MKNAIVFNSELGSLEKLVYLYLACCANNKKQACLSMNKIAKHCSISRASVKRTISALVKKGWISKESRCLEDGNYVSNLYTIHKEPSINA
ncbi:MAG TPA: helix-turn-helix domain-containing protein [Syntrophomonadaceae bacterium]|nr:helix-turn-helix domain-containing protein [Syntrophomonadaceae bacterium]